MKYNLTYLIDANNVIGKDKELFALQKKDKISSREVLAHRIDRAFANKKINVLIFFDGFKTLAIKTSKTRIYYSDNKTADELIKNCISDAVNKKNITVVSSDHNVQQFARVCSCTVKSSEDFLKEISRRESDSEESRINSIDNEEIKKLFGL